MADKKISALNAATLPLAGTEVLPIVQSATTVKATIANVQAAPIAAGIANGVQYLNGSKAPTTGSVLQYDGVRFYNGLIAPPSGWTGTGVGNWIKQTVTGGIGFVAISSSNDAGTYIGNGGTAGYIGVSYGATAGYKPLVFQTSDADRWQLEIDGTLTQKTAAKGINFTANTPAAGMTSQLLNWYEEGTWTPNQGAGLTVVGAFSSNGTYIRVGRSITVKGQVLGATTVAVAAAGVISSNLPFTAASGHAGSMYNAAINVGGTIAITSTSATAASAVTATPSITFTATYQV